MNLGNDSLRIAEATQLATLIVAPRFKRRDLGVNRRELVRRSNILADRSSELHDHQRDDEHHYCRRGEATGETESRAAWAVVSIS